MGLLVYLITLAFDIYIGIVIIQVIIHWLAAFSIIKINTPQAQNLVHLMERLTDPVYKPLRQFVPPIGGIDITPLIVIIGLGFLKTAIVGALL